MWEKILSVGIFQILYKVKFGFEKNFKILIIAENHKFL
jgi:hypothetical protein